MTVRKVAVAAGLALAAEAFMIPSTITLPGLTIDKEGNLRDSLQALRMHHDMPDQLKNLNLGVSKPHAEAGTSHVLLDCPGCSFRPEGLSAADAAEETANDIVLDFAISEDRKALELNGLPIYPFLGPNTKFDSRLPKTARQSARKMFEIEDGSIHEEDHEDTLSAPRQLVYTLGERKMSAADGTEARLIDTYFHINALDDEKINVDNVDIRMLSDESGNLNLVHVVTAPSPNAEPNGRTQIAEMIKEMTSAVDSNTCAADEGHSRLAGMMCRLRAQIKQKVHDWRLLQPNPEAHSKMRKPCPGRFRQHLQAESEDTATVDVKLGPRPPMRGGPAKFMPHAHHPGHYRHHRHHSLTHGFATALRGFVLGFVVPILIGVIAGMTASLVGMVVGTMIAWLWVKLVRGGKRGNCSARQEERAAMAEEEVFVGEKDELMLEHAPAYEEVVGMPPTYAEKE